MKRFFNGHILVGRPWPPIVLAGTEARPTEIFQFLRKQRLLSDCLEMKHSEVPTQVGPN